MKKKYILFYLRSFNDTDHISPIIYEFLKNKEFVKVIYVSNFDFKNDYRMNFFLNNFENFQLSRITFFKRFKNILVKIFQINKFRMNFSKKFNNQLSLFLSPELRNVYCVIFDWGEVNRNGFQDAKYLSIPNICLPHGLNIFKNMDVNPHILDIKNRTGRWPDHSSRNKFDAYIFQSQRHLLQACEWGHDPKKTFFWGSARFDPIWCQKNLELLKNLKTEKRDNSKLHISFFLPHWSYNVNYAMTIDAIKKIIEDKSILLVIKGHTRGTGSINNDAFHEFEKFNNIIINSKEHSPTLIKSSDIVINFGSSIGIEAIIQNKIVINPKYLHKNKTIFNDSKLAYDAKCENDLIELIQKAKSNKLGKINLNDKEKFMQKEVYAGDKKDIPNSYFKKIKFLSSLDV